MKLLFMFICFVFACQVSAQVYAVHDETNRQQLYLNAVAQINAIETNRKWLDVIIEKTHKTAVSADAIDKVVNKINNQLDILIKKVGNPELINTGVSSAGEANIRNNLSLQDVRTSATNANNLKSCDSEALYGDKSKIALKYNVSEAAYINYENVLKENKETKERLIAKRNALAMALESVRSVAETNKVNAALQVVNGKLATIKEQEDLALNKLKAIQIRNDQQEKLKTDAKAKELLLETLNYEVKTGNEKK